MKTDFNITRDSGRGVLEITDGEPLETNHTPEPWQVGNYNPTVVYAANPDGPISVTTCGSFSPSEARANARRIVACVNACAGILDDVLPMVGKELEACLKQRDELAEALRHVVALESYGMITTGQPLRAAITAANNALAKVSV